MLTGILLRDRADQAGAIRWQVNLLGGYPAALAQMEADGIRKDQIPDWMGGGSKGIVTRDFLETLLKENGV